MGPEGFCWEFAPSVASTAEPAYGGHTIGSRKMDFGFNFFLNVVWWELALVVLLLAAYALAPVLCVVASGKCKAEEKCVAEQSAPRSNQRRGRGRGRGPIAG